MIMFWVALFVLLSVLCARVIWLSRRPWYETKEQRWAARQHEKAKRVELAAIPKRPSAFDPADKGALDLTEEDKRWFNHIARLCESAEPYPFSEPYDAEAKMKAAGYTREMPDGEWESTSNWCEGTWYRTLKAIEKRNKFNEMLIDSLDD